jgi:hypothetical protein
VLWSSKTTVYYKENTLRKEDSLSTFGALYTRCIALLEPSIYCFVIDRSYVIIRTFWMLLGKDESYEGNFVVYIVAEAI